jgi:hypothetical protein
MTASRWAASSCLSLALLLACSSDDGATDTAAGSGGSASGGAGHGGSLFSAAGGDGGAGAAAGSGAMGGGPTAGGGGTTPFSAEVSCGAAICSGATPVCCVQAVDPPACAAYMGSLSCGEGPAVSMFCDDPSDCLAGQVCCVDSNAGNGGVYTCGYAPCATHEACTPGGTCEQAGFVCIEDPQQASGAKCVPQ